MNSIGSTRGSALLITLALMVAASAVVAAEKTRVGWLEEVSISQSDYSILAKVDTGADNSSINADAVKVFERDGKKWVKFTVVNRRGEDLPIEKPVKKRVRIKTKDGKFQRRYVVELTICMHTIRKTVPVNLIDRSHFKYQMLIGRSFLRPEFVVDSDSEFLKTPACK